MLQLNTGFYDKGMLNLRRKAIMKNYYKEYLLSDMLAAFPVVMLMKVSNSGENNFLIMLLFLKLIRLSRIGQLMNKI